MRMLKSEVVAIHRSSEHTFSKSECSEIEVVEGRGVLGDAHFGKTVKHRSRVAKNPAEPNLRQIHLIHAELLDELALKGFDVRPGDLGENITTRGIELLSLSTGARLRIGKDVVVEVTGLRNPCKQIEEFQAGLLKAVLGRDENGALIRKTGVMGIVKSSGTVRRGDPIEVEIPSGSRQPLEVV